VGCADWVSFIDANRGFALCGLPRNPGPGMASKALWRTVDGGEHWALVAESAREAYQQRPGELPLAGYASGLHFRTVEEGWIALSRGGLLYTHDGGKTWYSQIAERFAGRPPVDQGIDYSEAAAVQFVSGEQGRAVLSRVNLAATEDGGRTWRIIFPPAAAPNRESTLRRRGG